MELTTTGVHFSDLCACTIQKKILSLVKLHDCRNMALCYGEILPWYKGTLRQVVSIDMFTIHPNILRACFKINVQLASIVSYKHVHVHLTYTALESPDPYYMIVYSIRSMHFNS